MTKAERLHNKNIAKADKEEKEFSARMKINQERHNMKQNIQESRKGHHSKMREYVSGVKEERDKIRHTIYQNKVDNAIENRTRAYDIYTMKSRAKYSKDYCDEMYKNSNSTLYIKRI